MYHDKRLSEFIINNRVRKSIGMTSELINEFLVSSKELKSREFSETKDKLQQQEIQVRISEITKEYIDVSKFMFLNDERSM